MGILRKPGRLAWAVLWTSAILSAESLPAYRLLRTWGDQGDGPGQLRGAHGICLDLKGNVIVVDSPGSRVYRYSPEGRFLGEIGGGPGSQPGRFKAPRDARVDPSGKIFVADGNNCRIQVFSPDGKFVAMFGRKGVGPGELLRPHAIDFDRNNRLYVADVDNSRVTVFAESGKFLFSWGKAGKGPGEFNAPHGIGADPQGDVFVSNYYGPVQKFSPRGEFIIEFAGVKPDSGPVHYHSMATDRQGNVYLTARDRQRRSSIWKYSNKGVYITSWNMPRDEQFVESAAVDSRGFVFVTYQGKAGTGVAVFEPQH